MDENELKKFFLIPWIWQHIYRARFLHVFQMAFAALPTLHENTGEIETLINYILNFF